MRNGNEMVKYIATWAMMVVDNNEVLKCLKYRTIMNGDYIHVYERKCDYYLQKWYWNGLIYT